MSLIKSAKDQWEAIKNDKKKMLPTHSTATNLKAYYRSDWIERTDFEICDAAKKLDKYAFTDGTDFTHIYSYNKVMSKKDCLGISEILNRTNFRILAWYFGPDKTRQTGLKHFELIHQEPMQSTGKEKFTVYVYIKTKAYDPLNAKEWEQESIEEDAASEFVEENLDAASESGEEEEGADEVRAVPKPNVNPENVPKKRGRKKKVKRRGRPPGSFSQATLEKRLKK